MTLAYTPIQQQIDLEEARGALARAVLTRGPDFKYMSAVLVDGEINLVPAEGCFYVPLSVDAVETEGDPRCKTGCLIGVALEILGIRYFHDHPRESYLFASGECQDRLTKAGLSFSHKVLTYYGHAQSRQDLGHSWGEAYASAEELIKRSGW